MSPRQPDAVRLSETAHPTKGGPAPQPLPETDKYGAHRDPAAEGKAFVYAPTVALPVGTVSMDLPRSAARTKYDWQGVRSLMESHPGLWVKAVEELSSGMYSYVRRGGPQVFVGMGGHMQVSLRAQREAPNGKKGKVGDLWVRWIPAGWTEVDQARVEAALQAGEGIL